jgi:hypothetical protein
METVRFMRLRQFQFPSKWPVKLLAPQQNMIFINLFVAVSADFPDFVHNLPDGMASVSSCSDHARHLRTCHSQVHVPIVRELAIECNIM